MHRFVAGTCRLELTLTPAETWIVRAGDGSEGSNRESTTRQDVRLKDGSKLPVLPASSLKGVMRGTAEYVLRSLQPDRDPSLTPLADATFGLPKSRAEELADLKRGEIADSFLQEWRDKQNQDQSQQGKLDADMTYPELSAASQLFGATLHAGLVMFDDVRRSSAAYVDRPHIAIDRFTGGVAHGATFSERLNSTDSSLSTSLTIENFALWQLALLHLVFGEINAGYSRLGGGTRKGHGTMRMTVEEAVFTYPSIVYEGRTGIISPQGWISTQECIPNDTPEIMRHEAALSPFPDLKATRDESDWRRDGLVSLSIQGRDALQEIFQELLGHAWLPWAERVNAEVA